MTADLFSPPESGPEARVRERERWHTRWGAPAAAVAGLAVLSVPRLGRRPVWLDEAYTVGVTHDLVSAWRGSGGTMALYYLLVWPVAQVSTDRVWVRLPSLVFAALVVLVVHEIGRLLGGRRMGAYAAGTLAATWSLSRFALEARSYTLAMLLVSLSWLGLVGAVRSASSASASTSSPAGGGDRTAERRWWALFAAATLLAPLAHGLAAAHFVPQVAVLALSPDRRRWLRRCVPLGALLAVEGALLFTVGAGEVANWIPSLRWGQVRSFGHLLVGRGTALWLVGALAVAGIALAVAAVRRRGPDREPDAWLRLVPALWALGAPLLVLALSVVRPYAEARYVLGALPGVALLVGAALSSPRLRPRPLAFAVWLVVAVALLQTQSNVTTAGAEDWPALADRLATEAEDGDRLLTMPKLRSAFDYSWAEDPERPLLDPLSPTDPVGDVRRFYDPTPGPMRSRLLADTSRTVWYVDRNDARRDGVLALMTDPAIAERYVVTGPWEFDGDLYLVRFRPRAAAPAG